MALTQVSTQGIKDGTITGTALATNVDLVNNQKLRLGNNQNLQIYYDNSSYITNGTAGHIIIKTLNTGSDINLECHDDFFVKTANATQNSIIARDSGQVELYYSGSKKFETLTDGIKVSSDNSSIEITSSSAGTSTAFAKFKGYRTSADIGRLGEIQFINQRDNDIQAQIEVFANGDTDAYFDFIASTNNNRTFRVHPSSIAFPDDNKLICGNSSDLQVYHD